MGLKALLNLMNPGAQKAKLGDRLDNHARAIAELQTKLLTHTHTANGAAAGLHVTSVPITNAPDAATLNQGAAVTLAVAAPSALT